MDRKKGQDQHCAILYCCSGVPDLEANRSRCAHVKNPLEDSTKSGRLVPSNRVNQPPNGIGGDGFIRDSYGFQLRRHLPSHRNLGSRRDKRRLV